MNDVDRPVRSGGPDSKVELLPFRFHRLDEGQVLVTNMVGEHMYLAPGQLERLLDGQLHDPATLRRLRAKHIVRLPDEQLPIELLAMKTYTRTRRLAAFTGLHIFVVTLRCEHACHYCQVSRRSSTDDRYDMSEAMADRALDLAFRSPSPEIKLEFQGGEPLLNFELIKHLVGRASYLNAVKEKRLSFVITSNLALLDDEVIRFAREHDICFSTSLDGPAPLHNTNRPRPGGDSWQRTSAGIQRIQAELGADRVDALMTTTEASLGHAREIIDGYVNLGLTNVFLRPVSPYGFAVRGRRDATYEVDRWLEFYEEGLDHILELNAQGIPVVEQFAAIVLRKMLTSDDAGYVDLMNPAGIGIGALVYNYDGDVYASDEGRMLAEMGDTTFRLGHLGEDTYTDIVTSDALLDPLEASFTLSAPMCSDCAFEPFCGADPVFHHTTMGDPVGRKPESAFCRRNMGVFTLLLKRFANDRHARRVFRSWANR